MCGITGIVQFHDANNQLVSTLKKMNDKLRHRGPDDEGYCLFEEKKISCFYGEDTPQSTRISAFPFSPNRMIDQAYTESYHIGFGHRRLSIIDLSAGGHQPMCLVENQRIWITFNGEIYNYIELREELIGYGFIFHTNSDVEVVLRAYEFWGQKCLDHLNGMWSFVLYDMEKNELFGSRDRFGVKPLYFIQNDQHFAFASEQKALIEVPSHQVAVNLDAMLPFLLYGQVELSAEGFFKDIFELQPGHFFTFNLLSKKLEINRYFDLELSTENPKFLPSSFDRAVIRIKEEINQAIRIRFRSDVPIGFCLSGGLDSSTIVCTAAQLAKEESIASLKHGIKTFTASNDSPFDESKWAKEIADHTNAEWHNILIDSATLVKDIQEIIYFQDIPLATTSTYAQSRVMKAAHEEGLSILIDGQGGDELFAGYQTFYYAYFNQLLRSFHWKTLRKEWRSLGNSPISMREFFTAFIKVNISKFPASLRYLAVNKLKRESMLVSPNLLKLNKSQINFNGEFRSEGLNSRLKSYCTQSYLKGLLRWEDRCSMQYSIESRTPFSDDIQLISSIFSMPANYKINKGWSKFILREAIKGLVPEKIRLRKDKKGFSIPQNQWLMEQEENFFQLFTSLKHLDIHDLVKKEEISRHWKTYFSHRKYEKEQNLIFRYVCYLIWLNHFINPQKHVL